MKNLLTKEDYEFVRKYCEKHNILEGSGEIKELELLLNAWKNYEQNKSD